MADVADLTVGGEAPGDGNIEQLMTPASAGQDCELHTYSYMDSSSFLQHLWQAAAICWGGEEERGTTDLCCILGSLWKYWINKNVL